MADTERARQLRQVETWAERFPSLPSQKGSFGFHFRRLGCGFGVFQNEFGTFTGRFGMCYIASLESHQGIQMTQPDSLVK